MKEQTAILPKLPIIGVVKLTTLDEQKIISLEVMKDTQQLKEKELTPFFDTCYVDLKSYLEGHSQKLNIPVDLRSLSPFQQEVLEAMRHIPYGEKRTYKDLAHAMGSKAYQAIGSACGKNPFLLIYPCHRVIGTKGPGGFAHGLEMKKKLWELEGQN